MSIDYVLRVHVLNKIGTYLIRQGEEAPTPIDKGMANRTLEIFSGDVLQFGQGNTYDNEINIIHGSCISLKQLTMLFLFIESDVYEGPRSDSNNNDDERREQQNVNKCIMYKYSDIEYRNFISICSI